MPLCQSPEIESDLRSDAVELRRFKSCQRHSLSPYIVGEIESEKYEKNNVCDSGNCIGGDIDD
jgi:hypothetical protein